LSYSVNTLPDLSSFLLLFALVDTVLYKTRLFVASSSMHRMEGHVCPSGFEVERQPLTFGNFRKP